MYVTIKDRRIFASLRVGKYVHQDGKNVRMLKFVLRSDSITFNVIG
jgi:hypothetical protein